MDVQKGKNEWVQTKSKENVQLCFNDEKNWNRFKLRKWKKRCNLINSLYLSNDSTACVSGCITNLTIEFADFLCSEFCLLLTTQALCITALN